MHLYKKIADNKHVKTRGFERTLLLRTISCLVVTLEI